MRLTLACLALAGVSGFAAPQPPSDSRIQKFIDQLGSEEWTERVAAFTGLVELGLETDTSSEFPVADGFLALSRREPTFRPALVSNLIKLLEVETALVDANHSPESEEYFAYYGDVIEAVVVSRDRSSQHALMHCINTGGMTIEALAGFGDDALSEAINMLDGADEETRYNLFRLFTRMAEPKNIAQFAREESRKSLLNALLAGAGDPNPSSRRAVVSGLSVFPSEAAREALNRLQDDPFSVTDDGVLRYPVREAATRALQAQAHAR